VKVVKAIDEYDFYQLSIKGDRWIHQHPTSFIDVLEITDSTIMLLEHCDVPRAIAYQIVEHLPLPPNSSDTHLAIKK
jgi:hypothetical protein